MRQRARPAGPPVWFLAACLLSWTPPAFATPESGYLRALLERVRAERLAERPMWRALVHYGQVGDNRFESEADDSRFFLSPRGKYDPHAELEATLAAFFSATTVHERGEPAQCAFIARYRWLREILNFDPARLPEHRCTRFEAWYRNVDPHSLTLVFPVDYLNNPSSMFGHTLLRVDRPSGSDDSPLLSYAINYGAVTGDDGGVVFAVKGLTGGYTGLFSILPYYEKVREYSDLENRDIWEYRLVLTEEEVRRVIEHLWELRGIGFDYYFFTENCSYQLLTLLDVARPSLQLAQSFRTWVIPADTVRSLRANDLLADVTYRPAAGTRLAQDAARVSEPQRRLAKRLAEQSMAVDEVAQALETTDERRDAIELAYDYLHYRRSIDRSNDAGEAQHLHRLLTARAQFGSAASGRDYARPAIRPDRGHPTAMLSGGAGAQTSQSFQSFRLRPVYHGLLDPSGGYKQGAKITLFDVRMRHFSRAERLLIERFGMVDIVSLSPRELFFRPISWAIRAGWDRRVLPFAAELEELTFATEGGFGVAQRLGTRTIGYGLLEFDLEVNGDFDDGYALGVGPRLGTLADLMPRWKLAASARYLNFPSGHRFERRELTLELRHTLNRRNQLELVLARQEADDRTRREGYFTWRHFF